MGHKDWIFKAFFFSFLSSSTTGFSLKRETKIQWWVQASLPFNYFPLALKYAKNLFACEFPSHSNTKQQSKNTKYLENGSFYLWGLGLHSLKNCMIFNIIWCFCTITPKFFQYLKLNDPIGIFAVSGHWNWQELNNRDEMKTSKLMWTVCKINTSDNIHLLLWA